MQERGRRRFDAILDAAASTLVEVGIAGFTMHGVAARARTSIGSMYHFFPDGESLLRALGERHEVRVAEMLKEIHKTDAATWSAAPLDEAVNAILDPIVRYMEAHPDLFAVPHEKPVDGCDRAEDGIDATALEIFERFIRARMPDVSDDACRLRARMVHAIAEGVASRAANYPVAERTPLFRELRVAVVAYLAHFETGG